MSHDQRPCPAAESRQFIHRRRAEAARRCRFAPAGVGVVGGLFAAMLMGALAPRPALAETATQPVDAVAVEVDACAAARAALAEAEQRQAERSAAIGPRLDEIRAALQELEARAAAAPSAELTRRREALTAERDALQAEQAFVTAARAARQAALDACLRAAGFRQHTVPAGEAAGPAPTPAEVAAARAELERIGGALAALAEAEALVAGRAAAVDEQLAAGGEPAPAPLLAERDALAAELAALAQRQAAHHAERAVYEARLAAVAPDEAAASAPVAEELDALNKQRLAEQLDAEARDRLAFAEQRLAEIEARLRDASPDAPAALQDQLDREYWRRIQAFEQSRLEQAELQRRAARQKEAMTQLRARIDEVGRARDELEPEVWELFPERDPDRAAALRAQAEEARRLAEEFDQAARAAERGVEPLQQRLGALEALETALRERLAAAATLHEYEPLHRHVRRMLQHFIAERQQIDLMVVLQENIAFAIRRQATHQRTLAGLYDASADLLDPNEPTLWERNRSIAVALVIFIGAVVVTQLVGLAVWFVQHLLALANRLVGQARFSVRRVGTMASFFGSIVKLFVWVFAVVFVLNQFGIDPAQSTGAIGLIGLIMAGMFREIVVDFVKGFDILAGRHYLVGDFVEVDGRGGHVVDFNVKHTRIRTLSGQEVNIPNSRCVPSRRFPDGFVDNLVDVTFHTRADARRAQTAIAPGCHALNRRIEPLREEPVVVRRIAGARGRVTLRYRVRVLPGCDWVVRDYFVPMVKEAVATEGLTLASEPTYYFMNRVEVFRKLFSRELTEEEITREVAEEPPPGHAHGEGEHGQPAEK